MRKSDAPGRRGAPGAVKGLEAQHLVSWLRLFSEVGAKRPKRSRISDKLSVEAEYRRAEVRKAGGFPPPSARPETGRGREKSD